MALIAIFSFILLVQGLPAELKEQQIQKQFSPDALGPDPNPALAPHEEESQEAGDDKDLSSSNTFGFGYYAYPRFHRYHYYPSYPYGGYYGGYRGFGGYYSPYRYYGWY